MCSAIFCKLLFFDRNSHFLILFIWCHFNYMSLPKQWVSEWLCLQEHLAHDGARAERDFQFIMTHSGTKHDISGQGPCSCQLVTSSDSWFITRFLDKPLGKKNCFLFQRSTVSFRGRWKHGEKFTLSTEKKMTRVLYLVILLGNDAGISNSSNQSISEFKNMQGINEHVSVELCLKVTFWELSVKKNYYI